MAVITPRWEWRAFALHFGEAERYLAAWTPTGVEESDEVYFLARGPASVKVRHGQVDIKALRQVDASGMQQWMPVRTVGFPLPAATVAEVCDALDIAAPSPLRGCDTFAQLLDVVTGPDRAVRVTRVHKRRVRYTIGGCLAERVEVVADGRQTSSIALESADPARVGRVRADLGLGGYANVSYPQGLAVLLGDVQARYAVIDVGTNSVKLHVGERDSEGRWQTVEDRARVTRLGEGMEGRGRISPAALDRTATVIDDMVTEAARLGAVATIAAGTAALRLAANAAEVVSAIETRTGVRVEVISGDDEARLAYLAARSGIDAGAGSLVVFDTGGGSSQFTFGHGEAVDERFSVYVGAAKYTEQFGLDRAVALDTLHQATAAMAADLSRLDGRSTPDTLVGMGGAVTNLAAVQLGLTRYDPAAVQGAVVHRDELDRQIELYRSLDAVGRRNVPGLQPERAAVILAGACIVRTIVHKLGAKRFTVSDRGLRHGLLVDRFGLRRQAGVLG